MVYCRIEKYLLGESNMKNKTISRIIALTLCLVMLLCFVACGSNGALDSYLENGKDQPSDSIIIGGGNGMSQGTQIGGSSNGNRQEPDFEPTPNPIPFPYPDYKEVEKNVIPSEDNKIPAGGVVMSTDDGSFVAYIPEGTLLNEGVTSLKLTISSIENSQAEVVLTDNEESHPFDVHIEGISKDNKVPVKVYISELLPKGLNMGNYRFYHVQNGETVEMTLVPNDSNTHNTYEYDPVTGDVNLYVSTFSEIAVIADLENKWEGNYDYNWYSASAGTEDDPYIIANADQLAAFSAIVGGMNKQTQNSFTGKFIKLVADINLGDKESENNPNLIFYPIGYYNSEGTYERTNTAITSGLRNFEGVFNGNGHTIANFYHNTWEMKGDHDWYSPADQYYRDGMGLFGRVYCGTVKNLTVRNFSSDGEIATTGVIAAYADGATFENIAIFDCNPRVYNIGNGGIVGCVGWYAKEADLKTTFKNITVDNSNKISALWGSYDVACGGIVGQYYPTSGQTAAGTPKNAGVHFENCHVSAQMDVYNDVCANYQYYAYRYTGMLIGSVRENETINGHSYPKMDGITAEGCTVHFGTWNDYYYCEIIDNTTASYTHDYQMSRLTEIKAIDGTTITYLDGTTGTVPATGRANYVIVDYTKGHGTENATCYHFKDGAVWTHDMGGIQTGVDENGDGKDDLKEDKQHIYLEFNNLVTGYGWGVTTKGVGDLAGVTILDREIGNSVDKFKGKVENLTTNREYTIDEIFAYIGDCGVKVVDSAVTVTITNLDENGNVIATFTRGEKKWDEGTISFENTGNIAITIQDYYFCNATTINVKITERVSEEKFVANGAPTFEHILEGDTINKTLGDIFAAIDGVKIDSAKVVVTLSNETICTYTKNESDWTKSTLAFTGEGTVTITITDGNYCNETTATITIKNPEEKEVFGIKFPNVDKYLYRVGNGNPVSLGSLFAAKDGVTINNSGVWVTITKVDANSNVSGTFTANTTDWTKGSIQFTGTGVVKVTIDSNAFTNAKELFVEVVNATNVTAYSELKEQNSVLLDNITMASGGTYRLTGNKVLYGNGFTFDVTNGAYAGVEYDYASYVIYIENSRLDNVEIKGAVYPSVGSTKTDDYYRAIIMASGDCSITNSFISNGASPIRNGGNLELVNTTLKGGAYANLDLRNGHLILDNVTTINQIGANDKYNGSTEIVGMGIVAYQEGGSEALKITIRNSLTQYNYLSETQAETYFTDIYTKAVKNVVFGDDFANYKNGEWINFGIISMNSYLTKDDVIDERIDKTGYFGTAKTVNVLANSRECYVYSFKPTSTEAPNYPGYTTEGQGVIAPNISFDFTEKNYVAKKENSNDYCYADGKKVYISMDEGDSFSWDTSIFTATKYGETLSYTVTIGRDDYTGKSIKFNVSGDYKVVFSYTDKYNYRLENGTVVSFEKNYTETIDINVSVIKATAKNAEFSFGANGTAYGAKLVTIGDKTYVMPDVTATVSGKIGSTTVNGTTVYYPITEMYTSDGKTAHTGKWYACFPIFKDALQIIDYADQGTGDPVIYNQTNVKTVDGIPSALKATNPTSAFLYSMNATNYPPPKDPTAVSDAVCYTCNRNGLTSGNTRTEMTITAEYTYTDNAGKVYYYYVGYHCAAQTKGNICVTADTLVSLADGTQKRVDQVTYEDQLLVWDFFKGEYTAAPSSIIFYHGDNVYRILKLNFADGTSTKVVNNHGFFDVEENKFVFIDELNVENYIGHNFVKVDGDSYTSVQLVSYEIFDEYTGSYSIQTAQHNNFMVENMFSITMPEFEGWFDYFEIGDGMKYDEEKMQADIEKYGLYTYEELSEYVTYEQFIAFSGPYLKVLVGRGVVTFEQILDLIEMYVK